MPTAAVLGSRRPHGHLRRRARGRRSARVGLVMPSLSGIRSFAIETSVSRGRNIPFAILERSSASSSEGAEGVVAGALAEVLVPRASSSASGLERLVDDFSDMPGAINAEFNRELRSLAETGQGMAVRSASAMGLPQSTVTGHRARVARPASKMQWARVEQSRRKTTGRRPDYALLQQSRIMDPIGNALHGNAEAAAEQGNPPCGARFRVLTRRCRLFTSAPGAVLRRHPGSRYCARHYLPPRGAAHASARKQTLARRAPLLDLR